ncbi:MAG: hypothetical protein ACYCW6_15860 [Candidatus Xenobia bacterium]
MLTLPQSIALNVPPLEAVSAEEIFAEALWGALSGAVPVLGALSNGFVASHLVADAGGDEDAASLAFAVGALTNISCSALALATFNPFAMLPSSGMGALLFAAARSRGI